MDWEAQNSAIEVTGQSAPLLNIPAELRNTIWRMVFLEPLIRVRQGAHTQPGLLRVCRQTRQEGEAIYKCENKFKVAIWDLKFAPQRSHWVWTMVPEDNVTMGIKGRHSWQNFKVWLQLYSEGKAIGVKPGNSSPGLDVSKFFEIIDLLKDLPWATVELVLEKHKEGLEGMVAADTPVFDVD